MSKDENEKLDGNRPISESLESQIGLVDYLDEFIQALRKQLHSDFLRWGNTWRKRPKEGQEMRTEARYKDYFDQFYATGEPVPWLKIVGNALICWIRDNHPELYIDSDAWAAELAGVEEPALKGVKVSSDGVEDILPPDDHNSSAGVMAPFTYPGDRVVHVEYEKIGYRLGQLAHKDIVLDTVVFTKGERPKPIEIVGYCDKDGTIRPPSEGHGLLGKVYSDGQYGLEAAPGLVSTDKIFISYDYEYTQSDEQERKK